MTVKETMIGSDGTYCVLTNAVYDSETNEYTWRDQINWCAETFGPKGDRWICYGFNPLTYSFRFKQKEDRSWFILRWS